MTAIELSKEKKQDLLKEIKGHFLDHRDEEISDFHATVFLEFVLDKIGPHIYNQAIIDAYQLMSGKIEDLYGLEKRAR